MLSPEHTKRTSEAALSALMAMVLGSETLAAILGRGGSGSEGVLPAFLDPGT